MAVQLSDLMSKIRTSPRSELTCTKDGRQWTLMGRGSAWDASTNYCIFKDDTNTITRYHWGSLYESVQRDLGIDLLEEGITLDDWQPVENEKKEGSREEGQDDRPTGEAS